MPVNKMTIKSSLRDYSVEFVTDNSSFLQKIGSIPDHHFIVDRNVWNAHKNGILSQLKKFNYSLFEVSEERKSLSSVQEMYDTFLELKAKKNLTLISIGGGIVQDVSGFTAHTLYRGINWIFVPTTLLAQADSCIGAKTSLNYKHYKNILGTFFTPNSIYICPAFLSTLSKDDLFSGIGEIAKLFMISGMSDVQFLINNYERLLILETETISTLIHKALSIKKRFIEEDEFDKGKRNMLNFGHCFGHGIESATKYQISHGLAVTMGIILANIVAQSRGFLSNDKLQFYNEKLLFPIIPCNIAKIKLHNSDIVEAMKHDKKRTGKNLPLIIIDNDNMMHKITDLTEIDVDKALDYFNKIKSEFISNSVQ